jgi:hypothetical protein
MKKNKIVEWADGKEASRHLRDYEYYSEWVDYIGFNSNKKAILALEDCVKNFKNTEYTLALIIELDVSQKETNFNQITEKDLEYAEGKIYLEKKEVDGNRWLTEHTKKVNSLFSLDLSNVDIYFSTVEDKNGIDGWYRSITILSKYRFNNKTLIRD